MIVQTFNSNQIGGSIVKITNKDNNAIILDYGFDLEGNNPKELPNLDNVIGIVISHGHVDHIGMIDSLKNIDVYFSEDAYGSYKIYQKHMRKMIPSNIKTFRNELFLDTFNIKLIKTSHSSFDSNMILINVDNKNILYTGDFRLHGLESNSELEDKNIDLLITEGTNITNNLEAKKEQKISNELKELQEKYKYIFVLSSSTNSERILSIGQSVNDGRYFIVDKFQKQLLDYYKKVDPKYNTKALYYDNNLDKKMRKLGFTMLVRQTDFFKKIMDEYKEDNYMLVYSMWRGYKETNKELKEFVDSYNNTFIHTSGHVSRPDLERFINLINPKDIMVLHTDNKELFNNMKINGNIIMGNIKEY